MNTLYTYGCSVTEDLYNLPEITDRVQYAKKFCGGLYKSWNEILADKLGMKPDNYAASSAWGKFDFDWPLGNTNEDVLEALALTCDKFKKGDVVVVQFTSLGRFRYVRPNENVLSMILPSHVDDFHNQSSLIDMIENKSNPLFIKPLVNSLNPYFRLAKEVGFDLYFWSNCDIIQEKMLKLNHPNWLFDENINDLLPKSGAHHITDVTNHEIVDYHLAQPGQEILADLIYNKIKE